MTEPTRAPRALWLLPLVAALVFLLVDSVVRVRSITVLTEAHVGSTRALVSDASTPSGYEGNQHNVVMPILGTDGYHWEMQTQQMLAGGGARIRHVDYDGPPGGRAVHWSSLLHWWSAAFAWVDSKIAGIPLALAVERVSPWVNTVFLALLLVLLVPVIARRFGALPAALFAVGAVAVYPFYEFYAVGDFDHHGLASTAAMLSVLCLLGGGAGWVRSSSGAEARLKGNERAIWEWLPDEARARRWFIASGIAGGAGLWISAATQVPALFGIGVAALAGTWLVAKPNEPDAAWRVAPELWRTWGIAGAASSLFFFALEYFPSHMGLRLEVNHPLYAIAWFGAGDLLFRLCAMITGNTRPSRMPAAAWIAFDVVLICALPAIVLLVPDSFMLRPGSFIMALHEDYIDEFQSLPKQLSRWSWTQINAGIGLLPLLLLGPAAVLCLSKRIAKPLRAVAILGLMPALVFTVLAFRHGRWLGIGCALWLATLVGVVTIAMLHRRSAWQWPVAKKVLLGVALSMPAAIVPIVLFHTQFVAANTAPASIGAFTDAAISSGPVLTGLLVALISLASVLPAIALVRDWTTTRLVFSGAFLGLVFVPFPALSLYKWVEAGWVYPLTSAELTEVVTRDVSHKLRARLGADRGVIASGPTTTTWMTYFGGFKGVGTLYWENKDGLAANAKLFGALPSANESAADVAFAEVKKLGVTHIVLYSWGPFTTEYARLAQGLRIPAAPNAADDSATQRAFGPQLLKGAIPPWLRPMPYRVPAIPGLEAGFVWVLEVTPPQSPEESALRSAQFSIAMNDGDNAMKQIDAALSARPSYLPALISLARVQHDEPKRGDFRATIQRIQSARGADSLSLEDNIGLGAVYLLAGDSARAKQVVTRAITQADAVSIRRLPWDYTGANFIVMARQLNLLALRPDIMNLVFDGLDADVKAQFGGSVAGSPSR